MYFLFVGKFVGIGGSFVGEVYECEGVFVEFGVVDGG